MLLIQAMNVHQGGGLSLLVPLLESAVLDGHVIALLDSRLKERLTFPAGLQVRWVEPTITGRISAERWIRHHVLPSDVVLCFGNLPPLWRLPCPVTVFVQNRLLIDDVKLAMFTWKTRARLRIERRWLLRGASHVDRFIVQTPTMCKLICERLDIATAKVSICAFASIAPHYINRELPTPADVPIDCAEFAYPASGDPYKNHRVLIQAWSLLSEQGLRPTLHLTVDKAIYPELVHWIETQRVKNDLAIVNHGHLPENQLSILYRKVSALIYPSLLESFGLPLLEARQFGLPVIAAELDYVRDVVQPVETFNPHSARSLCQAVRRFLGQPAETVALVPASDLLKLAKPG